MNMDEPNRVEASTKDVSKGAVSHSFFSTPELTQRLDLLRHLTDNSERVVILKGPAGSGKSSLLNQFKAQARPEWQLCAIEADAMLQPDQLFSLLFRAYGLGGSDTGGIEDLVNQFSLIQSEDGIAVIVVDDAHLLPVATIIALLRLHERRTGTRALVRILLFASAQIADQLQTPQIQSMNLQSIQELDMPRFSVGQCKSYVDHVVKGLSDQDAKSFTGRVLKRIGSEGAWPGEIESQLLGLAPAGADLKSPRAVVSLNRVLDDLPNSILYGVPVLGAVLLLTLIFQNEINRFFEAPVVETVVQLPPESLPPVVSLKLPGLQGEATTAAHSTQGEPHSQDAEEQLFKAEAAPELALSLPETGRSVGEPLKEPLLESEVVVAALKKESTVLVSPPEGVKKEPQAVALAAIEPEPKAPEKEAIALPAEVTAPQDVPVETKAVATPVKKQAVPVLDPKQEKRTVVAKEKPPAPVKETGFKGKVWLLKQAPSRYTLQLIGVQEERAAKQFIRSHRIMAEAAYFKTEREGKPWFSVVFGVYSGRDAAVAAKKKLPISLKGISSWPRSFGSIQQALAP